MLTALVMLAAFPAAAATPREPPCRVVYAPLAYRAAPVRCRPVLPRQFVERD